MPVYPFLSDSSDQPGARARLRAGIMRALATVSNGQRGTAPPLARLDTARILVIRPDHLGDLLFLGPALRWLRARLPAAHLALAIGPWGRPALPGLVGSYDELITLPFPAFERGSRANASRRWWLLYEWAQRLRAGAYDIALVARPDHWWGAMLARWAGIPYRLGFKTPETSPWLSHALPLAHEHAVASNIRLVSGLTGDVLYPAPDTFPLRFQLDPRSLGAADALLFNVFGIDDYHPLAIIHPGSGAAIKLWEPQKWRAVADHLAAAGVRVLVTGGPDEETLTRSVAAVPSGNVIDVGGQTDFATLAALLHRADVALGPDSGPLHLAVAVGTPTVHLYGPSDPVLFGPWGAPQRHRIISSDWTCAPCGKFDWLDLPAHACVRDIPVQNVVTATDQLLGRML